MSSYRPKPRRNHSARNALLWLLFALAIIGAGTWFFYNFVLNYDFEGFTPGTEPVQTFLPEGGYIKEQYPPFDPNAKTTPTPMPTPRPTPIPQDKYALLEQRLKVPANGGLASHGGLSDMRISVVDDYKAFAVKGYGYLDGYDAAKSTVYLVLSTKYGESHRIYQTRRESGCTGILHPDAHGQNLDQSDFVCNIRIEDNFPDGEYRLGVLITRGKGASQMIGYARIDSEYNFMIKSGKIEPII